MTGSARQLLFIGIASVAIASAPAAAQTLALTYGLDTNEQAQRSSIANTGCAGFKWVASVRTCDKQETLGRFSRQGPGEEGVGRYLTPERPALANAKAGDVIPFLGESSPTAAADPRVDGETEFNFKIGERPRVRQDIERRFYDAAQEARFNRNAINALGLEVVLPIQSKIRQSADPALPQ